jgi:hypothetical protein
MIRVIVICGVMCALTAFVLGAAVARGADGVSATYPVTERVLGRSYGDWNREWARFEWSARADQSPLLHPGGCRHRVVGGMFFLPGPLKGQVIRCHISAAQAVFVPTASTFGIRTSEKDTQSVMRRQAQAGFRQTKVLDVAIDGGVINARSFANTTKPFTINMQPGNVVQVRPGMHVAIQSGYNMILRPLVAGVHRVKMHVRIADGGKTLYEARTTFVLDVS